MRRLLHWGMALVLIALLTPVVKLDDWLDRREKRKRFR